MRTIGFFIFLFITSFYLAQNTPTTIKLDKETPTTLKYTLEDIDGIFEVRLSYGLYLQQTIYRYACPIKVTIDAAKERKDADGSIYVLTSISAVDCAGRFLEDWDTDECRTFQIDPETNKAEDLGSSLQLKADLSEFHTPPTPPLIGDWWFWLLMLLLLYLLWWRIFGPFRKP